MRMDSFSWAQWPKTIEMITECSNVWRRERVSWRRIKQRSEMREKDLDGRKGCVEEGAKEKKG